MSDKMNIDITRRMKMQTDQRIERHRATIYRTKHYSEEQIRRLQDSGSQQEKDIARWFWKHPETHIGPGKLHELNGYTWPITSTRRAINNLTASGILLKTEYQSMGIYGKPEYHWQWKKPSASSTEQKELFNEKSRCQN